MIEKNKHKKPLYSIVIPCHNEEKNVILVYKKIVNSLKDFSNFEIIFVNDGSTDNTLEKINLVCEKDKRVKCLDFSRNFGHQSAITAGMNYTSGEAIITLDCDLQDPPEVIVEMIKKWEKGFDVVYARRKNRKDHFLKKYSAILYYKLLDKFSEVKIPRNVGDFRLISRKVLDALKGMKEQARYLRGMVAWLGFKYAFVDYDRPERINGKTSYTLAKMLKLAMDGILNFSLFPLKVGLFLGIISLFVGSLFLLYMTGDIIIFGTVYELYKWLAVIALMFMGFQFILTWILGEYVGRIYNESKSRPLYVVTAKTNF
ncbi:glycosyltransferase family 2 protein [Candidatus Pacearchaeota archaeon]|nr:glycosyltransferase family 2 protein [Candidatus Pacearchaeota archaeon]